MSLYIYINKRGHEIPFTESDLRDAGIRNEFLPRWTSVSGWDGSGMAYWSPRKNADILMDLLNFL